MRLESSSKTYRGTIYRQPLGRSKVENDGDNNERKVWEMRERVEAMLAEAFGESEEIALLAGTALASGEEVGTEIREDALILGAKIATLTELLGVAM